MVLLLQRLLASDESIHIIDVVGNNVLVCSVALFSGLLDWSSWLLLLITCTSILCAALLVRLSVHEVHKCVAYMIVMRMCCIVPFVCPDVRLHGIP
jgi:hypothetical protein